MADKLDIKKSNVIILVVLLFLITLLLSSDTSNAATPLYVNVTSGDDSWDGTSPTWIDGTIGPMKTIQTAVNTVDTAGTVNVASGTYSEHVTITKSLNLIGENPETTTIDGTGNGVPITVATGINVNITNFTITNGSGNWGGAIRSEGDLSIDKCNISVNTAGTYGGGIMSMGRLKVTNSYFAQNTAGIGGGAISGSSLDITNSIFTLNSARMGGAISGNGNITDSTFLNNTALLGGAICGYNNITNSIIANNTANSGFIYSNIAVSGTGGGIYVLDGQTNIINSIITTNTAEGYGGGIYTADNGPININGSTITNNSAYWGGGIYANCTMNLTQSLIDNNSAFYGSGGGIYIAIGPTNIIDSNLTGNTAGTVNGRGGGIYVGPDCEVNLSNVNLTQNMAYNGGGGIFTEGILAIDGGNIIQNMGYTGGGVYSISEMTIIGTNISQNVGYLGGGLYSNGPTNVNGAVFTGNAANTGGGIAYSLNNLVVNYSRLAGNSALNGREIYQTSGIIDARYNWWGQNSGPQSGQISGTVNYNPWLYMTFNPGPTSILNGSTSQLTANFNNAYDGTTITPLNPENGHMPDGCKVTVTTDLGSVESPLTAEGVATATLNADEGTGFANVSGSLDSQEFGSTIWIHDTNRYVNWETGNDLYDGTSPTYLGGIIGPVKTIQAAINTVETDGTVNVASGIYAEHLSINKSLNMVGANRNTTIIDGTYNGRVIYIAAVPLVTITNLTLRNGKITGDGGGIYSLSGLLVDNCLITNNNATYRGGGIYAAGTATVNNSVITGNNAPNGGGIAYGWNTLVIRYSRLTNNTSTNGKEIYQISGTVDAQYNWWGQNSGPQAGQISGTVNYNPWLYMTFNAIPTSILNGETSHLVANFNNSYDGTTITPLNPENGHLPDGEVVTFTTDLGSVINPSSTSSGVATATLNADEGTGFANVSAAMDTENMTDVVSIHDYTRYVNGSTGNDLWDGTSPTFIHGTIGPMKTIEAAMNAVETGGTVNVASGTYNEDLVISKDLNLVGENRETTIIDGANNSLPVSVGAGVNVIISNFTIRNGRNISGLGGGICNLGNLTINNSIITNNNATLGAGGGIYTSGTLIINNSEISGNNAFRGGGIYQNSGTCTVTNSTLHNNVVTNNEYGTSWGGAIYQNSGTFTLNSSEVNNNHAAVVFVDDYRVDSRGGGIYSRGIFIINNTTVTENTAMNGGGIYQLSGTLNLTNSNIDHNAANIIYDNDGLGGGIYSTSTVNIINSLISFNTATDGGGMHSNGITNIINSSLANNTAWWAGGSIFATGTTNITDSTISDNTAFDGVGGGGYLTGPTTITGSTIANNNASVCAGINSENSLAMDSCLITGNIATIYGSALGSSGSANISNSIITNNTVTSTSTGYSVIIIFDGTASLHFNSISGNSPNTIYSEVMMEAENNWWGNNSNPSSLFTGPGVVNYSPWLYMTFTANPTSILNGSTSQLTANFNNACSGTVITPMDPANGHLPNGCKVTFTTDLGSVGSATTIKTTSNGTATATLTANEGTGIANVSAQTDTQYNTDTIRIHDNNRYVNSAEGNDAYDGTSPTYISGNVGPKETIQSAINAVEFGGNVNVASGIYQELLTIGKNLNLMGAGQDLTVIDGSHSGTVITVSPGTVVNLTGITILNGTATFGGGIYNYGTLTLNNSKVTANYASTNGGGIRNDGTVNILNCNIMGNNAGAVGGGISNYGFTIINNTNITGNSAGSHVGAVLNMAGTITITNSTITDNTAPGIGAIRNYNGYLTVNYCNLANNSPTNIDNEGGSVDARYNWWGTNSGPTGIVGTVTTSPWLYMTMTANPTSVLNGEASQITASLNNAYDGTTVTPLNPENGHIPDGLEVTFACDSRGSINPTYSEIWNGIATTTFTGIVPGSSTVNATLDSQTVPIIVIINSPLNITAVNPINGSTVLPNTTITITFNENIQPGTNYNNIKLWSSYAGGTIKPSTITINNNTLTITPTTTLKDYTYNIIIPTNSITDLAGNPLLNTLNSTFTVDTKNPTITTVTPTNGSTVLPNTTITITFNENIQPGTNYNNIKLWSSYAGGTIKPSTITINNNTLTITPTTTLKDYTYNIIIPTNSITDLAGNPLLNTLNSTFTVTS